MKSRHKIQALLAFAATACVTLASCPRPPQNRPVRIAVVSLDQLQAKAVLKMDQYCPEPRIGKPYFYPDGGNSTFCENIATCIDDLSKAAQGCTPSDMGVSCGDQARSFCATLGVQ